MLSSKILRVKQLFTISTGEKIVDLIQSTFSFGNSNKTLGLVAANEDEVMRPDKLSERLYSNQEHWDFILKFNGISNPFSLDFGEILYAPSVNGMMQMAVPPKTVVEKGTEPAKKNESAVVKPKSKKDARLLEAIRKKTSEVVPPNINLTGAKNVKVINDKVIFGGDMTQTGNGNINQSTVRNRIQTQLQNNQTF